MSFERIVSGKIPKPERITVREAHHRASERVRTPDSEGSDLLDHARKALSEIRKARREEKKRLRKEGLPIPRGKEKLFGEEEQRAKELIAFVARLGEKGFTPVRGSTLRQDMRKEGEEIQVPPVPKPIGKTITDTVFGRRGGNRVHKERFDEMLSRLEKDVYELETIRTRRDFSTTPKTPVQRGVSAETRVRRQSKIKTKETSPISRQFIEDYGSDEEEEEDTQVLPPEMETRATALPPGYKTMLESFEKPALSLEEAQRKLNSTGEAYLAGADNVEDLERVIFEYLRAKYKKETDFPSGYIHHKIYDLGKKAYLNFLTARENQIEKNENRPKTRILNVLALVIALIEAAVIGQGIYEGKRNSEDALHGRPPISDILAPAVKPLHIRGYSAPDRISEDRLHNDRNNQDSIQS